VSVDVGVFDDEVTARGHQRRKRVQLGEDVVFLVIGIEDHHDAGSLRRPLPDVVEDLE
jgi:hypothetical protein